MSYKDFRAEFKASAGSAKGEVEALVATWDKDRVGDRIRPGAFADNLKAWKASGRKIPFVWSHQWQNPEAVIGSVVEAKETDKGLYVRAQLDMAADFARKVWDKLASGLVNQFSFAYEVLDAKQVKDPDGSATNELRKLDLLECGPCLIGANGATELLSAKTGTGPRSLASEIAAELAQMYRTPGYLSPAQARKTISAQLEPMLAKARIEAEQQELDELELLVLENHVRQLWGRKNAQTGLDILRSRIADGDDGGHSAAWVEVQLEHELRTRAERLVKEDSGLGGDQERAYRIIRRELSKPVTP